MDFDFTEEQNMFRQSIREFAQNEIAPLVEECQKNERFPVEIFPKLGEMGYLGVSYPTEYGGAGLGKIGDCIGYEEIALVDEGVSATIGVSLGGSTSPIYAHGTEEQKQKYLVPTIKGRKTAAIAISEANAGSDVASIESTARRNGDAYILNGVKSWVTSGTFCDFVLVLAYTDKSKRHRGMSLFLVEKGAPGLSMTKLHKFCHRPSETAEQTFEDCVVPRENLLGEENKGFRYIMECLNAQRINHAASRLGGAEATFNDALNYAQQRTQFGRPIGTFQAIAYKLAEMTTEVEAARWMVYHAAWLLDQDRPCEKEASMAKLLTSEVFQRASVETMEIYGGSASLEESKVYRHYTDSWLAKVTEGTSEIQKLIIARRLGLNVAL